jgi:uncharacterized protein YqgV (UPF0045/DUF77 family)
VYPLRQEHLTPAVEILREALQRRGLRPVVGPMSTQVAGDLHAVLDALGDGFQRVAETSDVVMTVTVSNACPGTG